MFSFQGGFLSLCFLWTTVRVIFWFFADFATWPTWLWYFVYDFADVCQCATFSLLILYYGQLVDPKNWPRRRANFATFYFMANTTMLISTILFAGIKNITQKYQSDSYLHDADQLYWLSSGVYFGFLVVIALYYVIRLYAANTAQFRTSKRTILVTSGVFVIFFSRCLYDFLAALNVISAMHIDSGTRGDALTKKELPVAGFVLFLLWEVVPTALVLIYFRRIPTTRVAVNVGHIVKTILCCRCWRSGPYSAIGSVQKDASQDGMDNDEQDYNEAGDTVSPVIASGRVYRTLPELDPYGQNSGYSSSFDMPYEVGSRGAGARRGGGFGPSGGFDPALLDGLQPHTYESERENWDRVAQPHSSSYSEPTQRNFLLGHGGGTGADFGAPAQQGVARSPY